jgi:hypothetical protein
LEELLGVRRGGMGWEELLVTGGPRLGQERLLGLLGAGEPAWDKKSCW